MTAKKIGNVKLTPPKLRGIGGKGPGKKGPKKEGGGGMKRTTGGRKGNI